MSQIAVRFGHVNLVCRDWKKEAAFYQTVFGCEVVPPERHLDQEWLARATNIPHAALHGAHLRLPGYGEKGPTLEIFEYTETAQGLPPAANRPGFAHIAFAVADVTATREAVLAAGGKDFGELITTPISGAGTITFVYMTDPEGNILEVQQWT